MELGSMRNVFNKGTVILSLLCVAALRGQAAPQQGALGATDEKPVLAEEAFKNVQVLRGISVKEFMEAMGFFSASLNDTCTDCHGLASAGSWDQYADETPLKQKARMMLVMMNSMNKTYFAGKRELTCYTCHRNASRPKVTPSLAEQYSTPAPEDIDQIDRQEPGQAIPDQVFDKYIQAVGGAGKVGTLTSFVGKGTYQGYDTPRQPVEIFAQGRDHVAQIAHGEAGYVNWVYNAGSAWVVQTRLEAPVPVLALSGGDLEGAKLEAAALFPGQIKQLLTNLRTGYPVSGVVSMLTTRGNQGFVGVDDRVLTVVQGTTAGGNNVKLYFDPKTSLLVRIVRYTNLPVGLIPTEIDFSDYRDVSGIKMPFRITKTWVDGQSIVELSSIQPNVQIDAGKFAKPPEPPK